MEKNKFTERHRLSSLNQQKNRLIKAGSNKDGQNKPRFKDSYKTSKNTSRISTQNPLLNLISRGPLANDSDEQAQNYAEQ